MKLKKMFENEKIILDGHFKLSSGKHSGKYINKDAIYSNPKLFRIVIDKMIERINNIDCDIITGPAITGAVLASPISVLMGKIFIYPEKLNNNMKFRRGYKKTLRKKKVLIIDDIITTGESVLQTINAINSYHGIPVKILSIWNRTGSGCTFCDVDSLINSNIIDYDENNCPMCKYDIPLSNPKEL